MDVLNIVFVVGIISTNTQIIPSIFHIKIMLHKYPTLLVGVHPSLIITDNT